MSYGYQQYGGNPYEQETPGPETRDSQSNPYGTNSASQQPYGSSNPPSQPHNTSTAYQQAQGYSAQAQPVTTQNSRYDDAYTPGATSAAHPGNTYGTSGYGGLNSEPGVVRVPAPKQTLTNQDFLARVESIRGQIRELTANIGEIGSVHQRLISSPDAGHSQLDNLVTNTQILNTKIQSQIRDLEADAKKSGGNTTKNSQIRTLKGQFRSQLEDYQKEEQSYKQRYQEQISREYRIVNPEATDAEVREAAEADWGNEGVFQTALKSNRTGAASSVLGNVRARHNDIQRIEKTLVDLNQMFVDLAAQVELQEQPIIDTEAQTGNVHQDTEAGNKHLDKGIRSARNRRKLKWWCFGISVLIVVILVAVIGGYFGYQAQHKNSSPAR